MDLSMSVTKQNLFSPDDRDLFSDTPFFALSLLSAGRYKSENVIYKNQTLSFKLKYSKLMFMGTTSAINIFYSYF